MSCYGDQGGYGQGGYGQGGYGQDGYSRGGYSQGGYDQGGYSQGGYSQGGNPEDMDFDENMDVAALARHFAGDTSNADAFNHLQVPETSARDLGNFDPDNIERSYREFQDAGGEGERGLFGFSDGPSKSKESHRLIGGAAAWAAISWFQNKQKNQGKQLHHSTLKKVLVAFATAKAIKWWEKSGGLQSGMPREAVVEQASRDAAALADTKFANDSQPKDIQGGGSGYNQGYSQGSYSQGYQGGY